MLDRLYHSHPIIFGCIVIVFAVALFIVAGRLEFIDDGYAVCQHCNNTVYKAEIHDYNHEYICDSCYKQLSYNDQYVND